MKKPLSLLFALLMLVSILAGCNNTPAPVEAPDQSTVEPDAPVEEVPNTGTTEDPSPSEEPDPVEDSDPGSEPRSSNAKDITSMDRSYFPREETASLSMWRPFSNQYIDSLDEHKTVIWMEEMTNVHVDWTSPSSEAAQTQLMLMLASDDVTDIIDAFYGDGGYYTQTPSYAVEDELILDLTDYIPQYMPNYSALIASSDSTRLEATDDSGSMPILYALSSHFGELKSEPIWQGMLYRREFAEQLGYDKLVTLDDWHSFLTDCKTSIDTCDAPLGIPGTVFDFSGNFVTAYHSHPAFYVRNGEVKYGPLDEGYRQAVENMAEWYAEGLIDVDFPLYNASFLDTENICSNHSAAITGIWGYADTNLIGSALDEEFHLDAALNPVLTEGDEPMSSYDLHRIARTGLAVTPEVEDIELVLRWLDQWYSFEASQRSVLGEEGVTYFVDDVGLGIHFSDDFGRTADAKLQQSVYTFFVGAFGLRDYCNMDISSEDNNSRASCALWDTMSTDEVIPAAISMTSEESEEFGAIYADLETYVNECVAKFVTGEKPMSEYDAFIKELTAKFDIETCIELKQAAYNRYIAR